MSIGLSSSLYNNPIFFVAKILLLFREQGKGNRGEVRVLKVLFTFLFVPTYGRTAIYIQGFI